MSIITNNLKSFLKQCEDILALNAIEDFRMVHFSLTHKKINSPIEEIFLAGFYVAKQVSLLNEVEIKSQFQIGKYKVDFKIYNTKNNRTILVECDGHDFHDKTKEQRAYEKSRDRFLQKNNYKVFHYTGSEINKNCFFVVSEVLAEVSDLDQKTILEFIELFNGQR